MSSVSSFYTSLSGLNAAQTDLNVTSNNIANVNSTGFKSSTAEFSDLISTTAYQTAKSTIGNGTRLQSISQEFSQGSVDNTDRSLDLTVSGSGFFVTKSASTGGQISYTRDGHFSLDSTTNNIVDDSGNQLQGLPVDALGNTTATGAGAMTSLHVSPTNGTAKATTNVDFTMTMPADAATPTSTTFSPTDPNSYNGTTSTTVYDSAGNAIPATVYFVHTQATTTDASGNKTGSSSWVAHTYVGDKEVFPAGSTTAQTLTFDTSGALTSPTAATTFGAVTPTGASAPMTLSFDYGTATKEGSYSLQATASSQDGATVGKLTDITVAANGLVSATYSDSSTVNLGKVAVASFVNPEGLKQTGNATWTATGSSGTAQIAEAGSDGSGTIAQGELETSNVDLTAQLVNLISAQRNFQANAKAIDTDKNMVDSIIQVIN